MFNTKLIKLSLYWVNPDNVTVVAHHHHEDGQPTAHTQLELVGGGGLIILDMDPNEVVALLEGHNEKS